MSDLSSPCWTAADAEQVLHIEALSGDKALFLATHTPVYGFGVAGSRGFQLGDASEQALLDELSDRERQHAFCVVEGEHGSGKSHLIRWLDTKWPNNEDVRLLIQRADGSLSGTLQQLKQSLGEFHSLFEALGTPQIATFSGRAADFASRLANMLMPGYLEKPLPDAGWCHQHELGPLIRNTYVQDHWRGPARILKLMDGGDDRRSEEASFHLGDILDLANHCHSVDNPPTAKALARKLVAEARILQRLANENCPFEDMADVAGDDLHWSPKVLDALNRRRNDALRFVLGVTPDGLKRLFDDLRRALHTRGQRLVLLLEDITSWQGVDDSLVDVLVTNAETRTDVCPVISVVGITPNYYQRDLAQGNYRDRITHHINLGSDRTTYAAALRTESDRLAFASRYLSASRAGPAALSRWYEGTPDAPPPNKCDRCDRRPDCHAAFGAHDGIGLFPFTRYALEQLFDSLTETGLQNFRTPRGLLQAVLSRTLLVPQALAELRYPGPEVESDAIEKRGLTGVLRNRVETSSDDVFEQERLRRLFAYWGNARPVTATEADGSLSYAGVKEAIVTAFRLPWLGSTQAEPHADRPAPTRREEERPEADSPDSGLRDELLAPAPREPLRAKVQEARIRRAPPRITKSNREKMRDSIAAFRERGDLENIAVWNKVLFKGVSALDHRKLRVDRFTFGKLFTTESVKLAGTGQERQVHFVVDRTPWIIDGLEALAFLSSPDDLEDVEKLDYRQKAAFFLRGLEKLARKHVNRRLHLVEDSETLWNPVEAATQVLLARAWLRGDVAATDSPAQQWVAILREPGPVETDPSARVKAWRDLLDGTNQKHARIRQALRDMVSSPQGEATTWGIADISSAAHALIRLQRFGVSATLDEARGLDTSGLEPTREAQIQLAQKLYDLPQSEREGMVGRAQKLAEALRGRSIKDHHARLRAVIEEISHALPHADTQAVATWLSFANRATDLIASERSTKVEDLIMQLESDPPDSPAQTLTTLAAAPAKDLETFWDLARDGETVVSKLLSHVEDLMRRTRQTPSLSTLHGHGQALESAAIEARQRLDGALS